MLGDVIFDFPKFSTQKPDFGQSPSHGSGNPFSNLRRSYGVIQFISSDALDGRADAKTSVLCGNDERMLQAVHRIPGIAQDEEEETETLLPSSGVNPVRLVAALKASADERNLNQGARLHAFMIEKGLLDRNVYLGNSLVSMYIKCGKLSTAQDVFDNLSVRNTISWNAIIAGNAVHGNPARALVCFEQMKLAGFTPNLLTYICVLKACASIGSVEMGLSIHAEILEDKSFQGNVAIGTALIDMYAKFGLLSKAQKVFDSLPHRNLITWNALIAGYSQNEQDEDALQCVEQMQLEGISPDCFTFSSILKSCGCLRLFDKGQEFHMRIMKEAMLDHDSVLGTALVDMYIRCGHLGKAQKVLSCLTSRNEASWNALLTGFAQQGNVELAFRCVEEMQSDGFSVDPITCTCTLSVCSTIGCVSEGQKIHAWILKGGLLEKDSMIKNALIDMYAKCGLLQSSCNLLHELGMPNVVSWNSLIAGYAQHGQYEQAIACLQCMKHDCLIPDAVTYLSVLKACTCLVSVCKGQEVHAQIMQEDLMDTDAAIGNALIGMYCDCGMVTEARDLFDTMAIRDIITWNALVGGYAQLGDAEQVFTLIDNMTFQNIEPDLVTFNSLLSTCSHRGLVTQGQNFFKLMSTQYGIFPTLEHHTSMIGLLGRSGHVEKAISMIMETPVVSSDFKAWQVVHDACLKCSNLKLGRLASKQLAHLNADDPAYLSMMISVLGFGGQEGQTVLNGAD